MLRLVTMTLCLVGMSWSAGAAPSKDRWSAFIFGGWMTKGTWQTIVFHPDRIKWAPVNLVGAGVAYELLRSSYGLGLEIELNAVQYSGKQSNREVNVPLVLRWHRFPWDRHVDTSAAIGMGLSLASETPRYEALKFGGSQPLMVYLMLELEAGIPDTGWSAFSRVHHRSPAWGTFGSNGGSNSVVVGARKRF